MDIVGDTVRTRRSSGSGCMEMLKMMSKEDILQLISQGLCQNCDKDLHQRIQNLNQGKLSEMPIVNDKETESVSDIWRESSDTGSLTQKNLNLATSTPIRVRTPEFLFNGKQKEDVPSSSFSEKDGNGASPCRPSEHEILLNGELSQSSLVVGNGSSVEDREDDRFKQVIRTTFSKLERINGKPINIVEGLELHSGVFNVEEQEEIVQFVYKLQHIGRKGMLQARTYSEPRKWIRGKGRVTIQFGCCYNYAQDKAGNPPGIVRGEEADPLPTLFKQMIKRLVRWHVLPPSSVPDSCIVNIYEEEDCIPPHIDHHDFVRPFCTVSLLSECNIVFGTSLKILSPGEFSGPVSIPLPVGSVMVFNGNGADVAKHCIPSVPAKRISITFRKMDDSKLPFNYSHDPELLTIEPLIYDPITIHSAPNHHDQRNKFGRESYYHVGETTNGGFHPSTLKRSIQSLSPVKRAIQSYETHPRPFKSSPYNFPDHEMLLNGELSQSPVMEKSEHERFEQVNRRAFSYLERINGEPTNILEGLELHDGVFNMEEQDGIVQFVYELQHIGREGRLRARTYSEPRKWIRGKGRVTIQFGCCYNYARDKDGNPPGIVRDEEVDPLPNLFKQMIRRMVQWHVLPPSSVPDSCIVNIYDEEDCIPPHIDHHDFVRPFCTVSLLSECNILFGTSLKILSPGEFSGPVSIPLPVGSVMVFNGNGADVAKHCIPSVPAKRISITFRKMDDSKLPFSYSHDPELLGIRPLVYSPFTRSSVPNDHNQQNNFILENLQHIGETRSDVFYVEGDKFSPQRRPLIYSPYNRPSPPNGHNQHKKHKKFRRENSQHIGNTRSDVFHVEGDKFSPQRRPLIYSPYNRPSPPNGHNQHKKFRRENSQHTGNTRSGVYHVEGDEFSPPQRLIHSYGTYPTGPPRRSN